MIPLQEVRRRLGSVQCPYCEEYPFEPTVLENGSGTAYYAATCRGCACTFKIPLPTQKLINEDPVLGEKLAKFLCTSCQHFGADLEFRCDPQTVECFYVMTCKECHRTLQEFR